MVKNLLGISLRLFVYIVVNFCVWDARARNFKLNRRPCYREAIACLFFALLHAIHSGKMVFKHHIEHREVVNGLVYRAIEDEDVDKAVDFYFDVFLKGFSRLTSLILHRRSKVTSSGKWNKLFKYFGQNSQPRAGWPVWVKVTQCL